MGIQWDGLEWDRRKLPWDGMEQKNMSLGQAWRSLILKLTRRTNF